MFKRLEGDTAILAQSGVYKVADLYERDGCLFAAAAGGYVRIYANGTTSKDKLQLDALFLEGPLFKDRLGRLCTSDGPERAAIAGTDAERLKLTEISQ